MPQYDNPAAFLPNPGDFQAGGVPSFMSGMIDTQRQQQGAPFLQELLKQQQMDTQKQSTELQEFQSPQGMATRQAQRQRIMDEGDVYNRTKEGAILVENEKARLAPYVTDQHVEEAKAATTLVKHKGATQHLNYFSGMFNILDKVPENQRAPLYNQLVNESGFDKNKMDPDIREYQATTMGHLAAARYAQVHTAEQEQKIAQEDVPAQAKRDVAKINAKSRMDEMSAQIKAGRFQNDQAMVASIEKSLRTGKDADSGEPLDEAARTELKGQLQRYKSSKLLDYVNKQTTMEQLTKMMATMSGDPEKARLGNQAYEEAVNKAREQGLKIMGMTPDDLGAPAKSKFKVGQTISVQGSNVQVVGVNPDGSARIKDPKTGRTGTYRQ